MRLPFVPFADGVAGCLFDQIEKHHRRDVNGFALHLVFKTCLQGTFKILLNAFEKAIFLTDELMEIWGKLRRIVGRAGKQETLLNNIYYAFRLVGGMKIAAFLVMDYAQEQSCITLPDMWLTECIGLTKKCYGEVVAGT